MTLTQRLYAIGCMLFLWYASLVIVPQLFLLLGIKVSGWQFWVCFPLFVGSSWMFHRNYFGITKRRDFLFNLSLTLLLFASCLVMAAAVFSTHESNNFHLEAIYALLDGWLPSRLQDLSEFKGELRNQLASYPLASWSYAALLASFSGSVEMGKAGGFQLFICSLLIGQHLGRAVFKFSPLVSWFLASITALNPIQILDLFSFSTDGLSSNLLFLAIAFSLYQINEGGWLKGFFALIAYALLVNTSINAIVPSILALLCFLGFLLLSGAYKWQKLALIALGWMVFSFGVLGWSPYTSKLFSQNPSSETGSYAAKSALNININHLPKSFLELNRFERFILSFYAIPQIPGIDQEVRLKKLFSPVKTEAYKNGNTEVAGLGPFAPEVLTLLFPLGLFVLVRKGNIYKKWGLTIVMLLVGSLFVFSESNAFRLFPQLWILVLWLFVLLFKDPQTKGIAFVLGIGLMLNSILLFHTYYTHSKNQSNQLEAQLQTIGRYQNDYQIDPANSTVFNMRALFFGLDTSKFVSLGSDSTYSNFIGDNFAKYQKRMADN